MELKKNSILLPVILMIPFKDPEEPEICHVHTTALENPGGGKTILPVNDHPGLTIRSA